VAGSPVIGRRRGAFSRLLRRPGLQASSDGVLATKSERKMLASRAYMLVLTLCLVPICCYGARLHIRCGNTAEENSVSSRPITERASCLGKDMRAVKICSDKILQLLTDSAGKHMLACIVVVKRLCVVCNIINLPLLILSYRDK